MARINKKALKITGDLTDWTGQVSDVHVESAETESDFVTFEDAAAGGGRDYRLVGVAAQDLGDVNSLHSFIWDNGGQEVNIVIMPYGNATPTVTEPHFTCTAVVQEPDGTILGGEADASPTAVQTVEFSWPLLAKPTKVTA